jgi:hypothetical protein
MKDELYWKTLSMLTAERIGELTLKIESRSFQGSALRWLQGLVETNKVWKLVADDNLYQIERHKQQLSELKTIAIRTFRGNDDD